MSPRVSLCYAKNVRQIKRTVDSSYWTPRDGVVKVSYEAEQADVEQRADDRSRADDRAPLDDLLTALCDAEREPRFREFVGLKSFRDQYLAARGFEWAETPQTRRTILDLAIAKGLVLTGKVPNPKSPQNPTTTIRLNRELPDVKKVLERTHQDRSPFRPAPIRGESLSATILAERR
jgi:hypothetical protein